MTDFFERLMQRKLVQWAIAYLAGAWVLLQVMELIGNRFGWPAPVLRGAFIAIGIGFIVTLLLAWYHGERGEQKVSGVELLLLASVLTIGEAALWRFGPAPVQPVASVPVPASTPEANAAALAVLPANAIAVLPFESMSGTPFDLSATPNFARQLKQGNLPWPPKSPIAWPLKEWP